MADIVESRMNVAALKRFDPYARDIVDGATHVALYAFEDNEWEKTSIEGALFLYRRNGKPFHSMLIMNRLNTNNLIEPVTEGLELQVQEPFLLYRNSRRQIFGIWFYDKDECIRIAGMINGLAKDNKGDGGGAEPEVKAPAAAGGSVDIFSMLSKAQDDYNSHKGVAPRPGPEPVPRAPDLASQSVMDFFAKAGSGQQLPPQPGALFRVPRPPADGPLLLQRLMSNPVHSVEHIEKQQRSVTPGEVAAVTETKRSGFKLKASPGDSKRKNGKPDPPKNQVQLRNNYPNANDSATETNGQLRLENDLAFMRVSSPAKPTKAVKPASPLATFLSQSQSKMAEDSEVRSSVAVKAETPQKPALMPPTMFTSSASKGGERPGLESALTPIRPPAEEPRPEPLTRNQLLQAFNYLIRNDSDFVTKLHEAYVKSFSELVS